MERKKRFTEYERGIIAAQARNEWGARRIAKDYGWKRSSVADYVTQYKKAGK